MSGRGLRVKRPVCLSHGALVAGLGLHRKSSCLGQNWDKVRGCTALGQSATPPTAELDARRGPQSAPWPGCILDFEFSGTASPPLPRYHQMIHAFRPIFSYPRIHVFFRRYRILPSALDFMKAWTQPLPMNWVRSCNSES